jgi:hypothetical protein
MSRLPFDPLLNHMLEEARSGMPLLRMTPATSAVQLLDYLETLSGDDLLRWTSLMARRGTLDPMGPEFAAIQSDPLMQAFLKATAFRGFGPGIRFRPVKLTDALRKEGNVLGIGLGVPAESWDDAWNVPASWLAGDVNELVPVEPAKLRRMLKDTMKAAFGAEESKLDSSGTRYVGSARACQVALDADFARGGPIKTQQVDFRLWLKPGARDRIGPVSYTGIWGVPQSWNYVTVANAERCCKGLVSQIQALADIAAA